MYIRENFEQIQKYFTYTWIKKEDVEKYVDGYLKKN